jgi:hypothetical protein
MEVVLNRGNVRQHNRRTTSLGRFVGAGVDRTNGRGFILGGMGSGLLRLGILSLLGSVVDRIRVLTFNITLSPSLSFVYS